MDLLHEVYFSIKKISKPLVKPILTPMDHAQVYSTNFQKGNWIQQILEPEPCFGIFFDEELINRKILPELPYREAITEMAITMYSLHRERFKSGNPPITYFSQSGLDCFIKTGRIAEIPPEVYAPFTMEERLELLTALLDAASAKNYNSIIVDESRLKLPNNIILSFYDDDSVLLVLITPDKTPISMVLYENSISYALVDFLKYLEHSDYVLPRSETLKIIEKKRLDLQNVLLSNEVF